VALPRYQKAMPPESIPFYVKVLKTGEFFFCFLSYNFDAVQALAPERGNDAALVLAHQRENDAALNSYAVSFSFLLRGFGSSEMAWFLAVPQSMWLLLSYTLLYSTFDDACNPVYCMLFSVM
jgi:hypothetical protein